MIIYKRKGPYTLFALTTQAQLPTYEWFVFLWCGCKCCIPFNLRGYKSTFEFMKQVPIAFMGLAIKYDQL